MLVLVSVPEKVSSPFEGGAAFLCMGLRPGRGIDHIAMAYSVCVSL